MGYIRFDFSKIHGTPATLATFATLHPEQSQNVADVANVAGGISGSAPRSVANVASVAGGTLKTKIGMLTSADDGAAFLTIDGGIPDAYADAFIALQAAPPEGASEMRWRQAIDDAGRFLDRWGTTAAALSWAATDLFEFIPTGCSGLAWELAGREVIVLTSDTAILSPTGSTDRAWFCRPISAS